MNIKEKASYVKGLFAGLELDGNKKETKLLEAIIDWMGDISSSLDNLNKDVDDICDQLDVLDEDLSEVEEEVFDEESDCDCGCDCDCDDHCDCGCHDDENFYEVECPSCGEKICLSEDALMNEEMDCPRCGELLEFDLDGHCDCGCEDECDCDDDCDCGCDHDHEEK